uniref:Uncharacterized protein n=1 Tax=Anopheles arabiensis TaxID=7173 RepID=A0A182IHE3_ANOAR
MAPLSCECSLHTRLLATSSLSSLIFSTLRISVHSFWLSLTRVVACVNISWHAVSSVDFSPSPCSASRRGTPEEGLELAATKGLPETRLFD